MKNIFGVCEKYVLQSVHICKDDINIEAIVKYKEAIINFSRTNIELSKNEYILGEIYGKWHDVEVFEKAIDSLKYGAVSGPEGWSVELIKRLKYPTARLLHLVYYTSLKNGRFPNNMKHAMVSGVFKSGYKILAANYRPISLTNHMGKLIEKVVR